MYAYWALFVLGVAVVLGMLVADACRLGVAPCNSCQRSPDRLEPVPPSNADNAWLVFGIPRTRTEYAESWSCLAGWSCSCCRTNECSRATGLWVRFTTIFPQRFSRSLGSTTVAAWVAGNFVPYCFSAIPCVTSDSLGKRVLVADSSIDCDSSYAAFLYAWSVLFILAYVAFALAHFAWPLWLLWRIAPTDGAAADSTDAWREWAEDKWPSSAFAKVDNTTRARRTVMQIAQDRREWLMYAFNLRNAAMVLVMSIPIVFANDTQTRTAATSWWLFAWSCVDIVLCFYVFSPSTFLRACCRQDRVTGPPLITLVPTINPAPTGESCCAPSCCTPFPRAFLYWGELATYWSFAWVEVITQILFLVASGLVSNVSAVSKLGIALIVINFLVFGLWGVTFGAGLTTDHSRAEVAHADPAPFFSDCDGDKPTNSWVCLQPLTLGRCSAVCADYETECRHGHARATTGGPLAPLSLRAWSPVRFRSSAAGKLTACANSTCARAIWDPPPPVELGCAPPEDVTLVWEESAGRRAVADSVDPEAGDLFICSRCHARRHAEHGAALPALFVRGVMRVPPRVELPPVKGRLHLAAP